jgi:DNA-binding FadR family transcriptional regulator
MIEPAAVAELARSHDDATVTGLRELLEAERTANTETEMRRAADTFHVRVVELAGNSTLSEYAKLVHYLIRGHIRRYESMRRQNEPPLGHGESGAHERLIELIEAGASHAASQHWRRHLETAAVYSHYHVSYCWMQGQLIEVATSIPERGECNDAACRQGTPHRLDVGRERRRVDTGCRGRR